MKDLEPSDFYYYNIYEQQLEHKNKLKGFLSMLVIMAVAVVFVLLMFMLAAFF